MNRFFSNAFYILRVAAVFLVSSSISYADVKSFSMHRATTGGKVVEAFYGFNANPDCTLHAVPSIQILKAPVHGTTINKREKVYPDYNPGTPKYKCNKVKISGIVVYYKPEVGFKGTDYLEGRIIFDGGSVANVKITIKVS